MESASRRKWTLNPGLSTPICRFAPSPTGRLHLGHAYSAILSHDYARERGGTFLLRIEDIDPGRSREEHVDGILEDLAWLGLSWDGPIVRQLERLQIYDEALDRLKGMRLIYPCYCTRADIQASATAPHGPDGILYPGTCRSLADTDRAAGASDPCAWRIDMARAVALAGPLDWHDERRGQVTARPERHGDVVLARKDAATSYHLAVTVDDAAQGVTDVVRGEDLFAATDVHRLLQALLGLPVPRYHHHRLLTDENGKRLAKRDHARTIAAMREAGTDPALLAAEVRSGAFDSIG
jgi:glutamyl-Q tRNA(Asp) synthetase